MSSQPPTVWDRRLREAMVFLLLPVLVYLALCLYSYSPDDPSWSHAGGNDPVANSGGWVGAWTADSLLQLFGLTAYIFPLLMVGIAWRLVRDLHPLPGTSRSDSAWLLLGCVGLLITGAALSHLHFDHFSLRLPAHAGGVLGQILGDLARSALGQLGATLILFGLLLVSITLVTGLSWFALMERIGAATVNAGTWLLRRWRLRSDGAEGRALQQERAVTLKAERGAPVQARADPHRATAAAAGKKRARRTRIADSAVPCAAGRRVAAAVAARRAQGADA